MGTLSLDGRSHKLFIASCLVVLSLHVTILFLVMPALGSRLHSSFGQESYPDGYDQLAANLASGHGYRFYAATASTVMREPGYPLILAGLYVLFGSSFTAVKMCNLVLAFGTALMMTPLARRTIGDGQWHGLPLYLLPSLLFLIHPGTILAECRGGVEIVFAFLIVLFIWLVCIAVDTKSNVVYAAAGIVLGIAVLVRSTPLLFPVFLLAYLLIACRSLESRLGIVINIAAMSFAMFVTISPWIIRNYALTGRFIPTTSVLGVSAQAGEYINEHIVDGRPIWILDREAARIRDRLALNAGYKFEDGPQGYYQTFYRTSDEIAFSQHLAALTVQRYRENPVLFARCVAQNVVNFWFSGKTWTATALDVVVQLPYLLLALIGVFFHSKNANARIIGILPAFIAYLMLIHAPILAQARYSIPLIPLLSILAASGIASMLRSRPALKASSSASYASA